jgi:hypothetical protein
MIMATLIKAVMSGLIATSALAVIGTSASVALTPKDLVITQEQVQVPTLKTAQKSDNPLPVQQAAWSQQDQQRFWEEEGDRG